MRCICISIVTIGICCCIKLVTKQSGKCFSDQVDRKNYTNVISLDIIKQYLHKINFDAVISLVIRV